MSRNSPTRALWPLPTIVLLLTVACADDQPATTAPTTAPTAVPRASATAVTSHGGHAGHAVGVVASSSFRFLDTPLGEQPQVTPALLISSPGSQGRVRANTPVTIRVVYRDFDNQPQLRTAPAGPTLGTQSQVLVEGRVQGHIHGYLQPVPADGSIPAVEATSFCVLERVQRTGEFSGIAEGECPAVPAGDYRLSAEFQTNSHTAILKSGPRATPTADVMLVRVR